MADLSTVNLNRLVTFAAVVESGSLTAAAERLGLAKSMVSKHMQLLEKEIGVDLLLRSTRKLSLTEAGRAFYAASRDLLSHAEQAIDIARAGLEAPRGVLRVASPIDYGVMVVTPLLAGLRARYPDLKVELVCGDDMIDLIAEGIDVTVRLGRLADSGHVAVRVGGFVKWLVASPAFVAARGAPRGPDDLPALPFIALTVLPQPYSFALESDAGRKRTVRMPDIGFATNTAYGCVAAAVAGDGVALATDFAAAGEIAAGRLVRLLPAWSTPRASIHAVFPASPHRQLKVRLFVEALKAAAA